MLANLLQLDVAKQCVTFIFTAKPITVKTNLLLFCVFFAFLASAQVPQNGFLSDGEGNLFIAIHAPTKITYDDFTLPVSTKKSTYVIKLDANGDLLAISKADGAATVAGPLIFKNDTLFFAQAAINSRGQNAGEIVLTKMNSELSYRSTVTYPLGGNARPMAVAYANNHWSFVYATMGKEKATYTLAGLSHVYADKWMKPLPAYHVSGMFNLREQALLAGSFMNSFRFDGKEVKSAGADMFLLNISDTDGAFRKLRATVSGKILTGYVGLRGDDFWVAGALLTENEMGNNSSVLYAGLVKENLDSERLIIALTGDYSEAIGIANGSEGAFVIGNFSGKFQVENVAAIQTSSDKGNDVFLLKLAANGQVAWLKQYGGINEDEAIAVAAMPDGGVVVVYSEGTAGYADGLINYDTPAPKSGTVKLVRLDGVGEVIWERVLQTENE
jgi:hypothetical protein